MHYIEIIASYFLSETSKPAVASFKILIALVVTYPAYNPLP